MIFSDRHEFVFIKTTKTAGSSVEVALSQVCGPDDVVTLLSPSEDGHEPRNIAAFRQRISHLCLVESESVLAATLGTDLAEWPDEAMAHLPAQIVADALPDLWTRYFTFTVERNPWERLVSSYHYGIATTGVEQPFEEWWPFGLAWLSGSSHYRDRNGDLLVDRVLRYEHLDDEMAAVGRQLGVDIPPLPRSKGGFRPKRDYREYFDDVSAARVADAFAWEIERFGYQF